MQNNHLRQHLALAVVTLILAAVLLALTFIPRQPTLHIQEGPTGGNSNQIAPPANLDSFALRAQVADGQLMMPQFTLSAS